MTKISVILATFNEGKNIKACLESAKWADEIVVVDGSSTDKTAAIATSIGRSASGRKKPKIRVFVKENLLMFHQNKQLAIEKATGDWLLYLDADERVTPELHREILRVIATRDTSEESRSLPRHHPRSKDQYAGFWIPRKNIIFGKWIKHTGWWPDYQLRLFKKGKAFLPCQSIHEQPKLDGQAGRLKNPLVHYNYQTVSQFVFKLNRLYTENDKNVFLKEGKKIYWVDAVGWPVGEFLKRFFKQEGYKDGLHGLVLSLLQAFSSLVLFAKIWEEQQFQLPSPTNFLPAVEKELGERSEELNYWLLTKKIKQTANLLKKVVYKIKRKFSLKDV